MKVIPLVENISNTSLKAKHGLSLYIETTNHKVLFDLGPDTTLFKNAEKKKLDLTKIDIVIISHGHVDHGGALEKFLRINKQAKIYIQKSAFNPHFTKVLFLKTSVGLNKKLMYNPQIVLLNGDYKIDNELMILVTPNTKKCHSPMNDCLYEGNHIDNFSHEQSLLVFDKATTLFMGCGHCGVVNIMERASKYQPSFCVGGFHLFNPINKKTVDNKLLDQIVSELSIYKEVLFYTCHCTGKKAYDYMSNKMDNLLYLSCGQEINI